MHCKLTNFGDFLSIIIPYYLYLSYYLIKTDGFSTKILQTCLKVVTEPDFWFKSLFAYRMVNGIKDCHIYSVPI